MGFVIDALIQERLRCVSQKSPRPDAVYRICPGEVLAYSIPRGQARNSSVPDTKENIAWFKLVAALYGLFAKSIIPMY